MKALGDLPLSWKLHPPEPISQLEGFLNFQRPDVVFLHMSWALETQGLYY